MTAEDLKQRVDELRQELQRAAEIDIHVRDMFGALMTDIVMLASEPDHQLDAEGVKAQLEQQATDFEVRHPRAAKMMRHIMDLLAKMGI